MRVGVGTYEVAFGCDITMCAALGTLADETSLVVTANEVQVVQRAAPTSLCVEAFTSAGVLVHSAFTVGVICPSGPNALDDPTNGRPPCDSLANPLLDA